MSGDTKHEHVTMGTKHQSCQSHHAGFIRVVFFFFFLIILNPFMTSFVYANYYCDQRSLEQQYPKDQLVNAAASPASIKIFDQKGSM